MNFPEEIVVTGEDGAPIPSGAWYVTVINRDAGPVGFEIVGDEIGQSDVTELVEGVVLPDTITAGSVTFD